MLMQHNKYALDVYNSLNHSNYKNPEDLQVYILESGISLSIRNDASFIIYNHLCVYEHQGTYNPNMAIRELIYFVSLILKWLKETKTDLLRKTKVVLPSPQFVVFYNGLEKQPERRIFRLSDHFDGILGEPPIELICEAININPHMNEKLKQSSYVLGGYCSFVEKVRQYEKEMDLEKALERAISECITEHVLEEFFREHGSEVKRVTQLDCTFERRMQLLEEEMQQAIAQAEEEKQQVIAQMQEEKLLVIEQANRKANIENIFVLLEVYGAIPDDLKKIISNETSIDILKEWLKLAAKVESMDAFWNAIT